MRIFRLILFVLFLAGVARSSSALDFNETTFGSEDGFGLDATLKGEVLYVSSFNRVSGALRFSEKIDGTWTTSTVENNVVDIIFPAEAETSLLIDPDGTPHIFYHHDYQNELRHAWRDDGVWNIETVDTDGLTGGFPEAVSCDGNKYCVCYEDISNHNLKVAKGSTGAWSLETVDNSADNVGSYCDIITRDNGDYVVAYYNATARHPKVAFQHAGSWSIESVSNGSTEFGLWNSLAETPEGALNIVSSAYKGSDSGESDIAVYISSQAPEGGAWTIQTVDSGFVGGHPSLFIDPDGVKLIVYRYLRYSALFGHASAVSLSVLYPHAPSTWGNIDGTPFCLGTYLFHRVLRSPAGKTYIVYHRSFGACGGNVSQIVVRSADPEPTPTATPTPTPSATASATPTLTATPDPEQVTPTPTPNSPVIPDVPETPTASPTPNEGSKVSIGYSASFSKKKGTYQGQIETSRPLVEGCVVNLLLSPNVLFTGAENFTLNATNQQSMVLSGVFSKPIYSAKGTKSILSKVIFSCGNGQSGESGVQKFTPKNTKKRSLGMNPNSWVRQFKKKIKQEG